MHMTSLKVHRMCMPSLCQYNHQAMCIRSMTAVKSIYRQPVAWCCGQSEAQAIPCVWLVRGVVASKQIQKSHKIVAALLSCWLLLFALHSPKANQRTANLLLTEASPCTMLQSTTQSLRMSQVCQLPAINHTPAVSDAGVSHAAQGSTCHRSSNSCQGQVAASTRVHACTAQQQSDSLPHCGLKQCALLRTPQPWSRTQTLAAHAPTGVWSHFGATPC
jgi:hypothetical protein